jgi:hypothetical protein
MGSGSPLKANLDVFGGHIHADRVSRNCEALA